MVERLPHRCTNFSARYHEFLAILVICNASLAYLLKALTTYHQAEAKCIVEAVGEIKHCKSAIKDVRENIYVYYSQ